jgi:hypothetical protein
MPPDDVRTGANVKDLTAHRRTRVRAVPDPQPPADDDYGAWIGYADEVQEDPARSTRAEASAVGSVPSSDAVSPTRPDDVLKQFATPPGSRLEPGPTPPPGTDADVKNTSEAAAEEEDVDNATLGRVDDSMPTWAGTGAHPAAHRQAMPRGSAELAPAAKRARKRSSGRIPAEPRLPRTRAGETEKQGNRLKVRSRARSSLLQPRGIPRAGWVLAAVVLLAVGIVALSLEGSTSTSRTPKSSTHLEAIVPTVPDASHLTDGPTLLSALNVAAITQTGSRIVEKSITRYEAAQRAAVRRRAAERARRHKKLLAQRRAKARRAQQRQAAVATSSSASSRSASTYTPSTTTSAAPTESSATTTPTYTPTTPSYTPPAQTSTPSSSSSSSQPAGPTGAGTQSGGCDPICK